MLRNTAQEPDTECEEVEIHFRPRAEDAHDSEERPCEEKPQRQERSAEVEVRTSKCQHSRQPNLPHTNTARIELGIPLGPDKWNLWRIQMICVEVNPQLRVGVESLCTTFLPKRLSSGIRVPIS